ncbi:hypothetical protein E4H12_04455 [Candidatus Thorarchaeota archaeon]|nr:hypothetical protein [Candidatus Thorarchaeota archaeon]TFG98944.1 MAG: hypothetical protein E4H12_04455 [Candidatus Thorarchaeota archaeon]
MKKYLLVLGLFGLILMMPTAQATLANVVIDSTNNIVEAGEEFPAEYEVAIDIKPDTLSTNSKCQWITCYIWISEGYTAHEVDFSSVTLGSLSALEQFSGIVDVDDDGVKEAMVKFDRAAFIEMITGSESPVVLTLTGMYTNGVIFTGTDTIILLLE